MSAAPLVSVITPAFNASPLIGETIASVQAQALPDWEMLIVDDCSRDGTAELVEGLAAEDPRIKLTRMARNGGPGGARNAALAQARGRFIAFLDSDDLWLPRKLERQTAFMRERDCAFSYTAYRRLSHDGRRTGHVTGVPKQMTYRKALKNTAITTVTVMLDRDKIGDRRMATANYEDYILWLEILKTGVVAQGLQEDLARYRVVRGSVSSRPLRSANWVWDIYRKHEQMSPAAAAYCLCHYGARAAFKRLRSGVGVAG